MKNFIILAGTQRSGVNACAWLLKQCGYIVGFHESWCQWEDADYDPRNLPDGYLSIRYAPFVTHGKFIDRQLSEIPADYFNELSAAVRYILSMGNFAILNQSFLDVVPKIYDQIKDHAKLVIVNRPVSDIVASATSTPEQLTNPVDWASFEQECADFQMQIDTVKTLFTNNERPVLEISYSDFKNSDLTMQLCSFANVEPKGEILDLSWIDTIIESFAL